MDDSARYLVMAQIITDVEALNPDQQIRMLELATATSADRTAAERSLARWQASTEWSQQSLIRSFPRAGGFVEEITASRRPHGLPFVVRTAVVDALQSVLVGGLAPLVPTGILTILCEPIRDVVYGGRIPGLEEELR